MTVPDLGFPFDFFGFWFIFLAWRFGGSIGVFKKLIICPAYQTRGTGAVVNMHVISGCTVICIPNLSLFDELCGERGSYYVPTARLSLVLFRIINFGLVFCTCISRAHVMIPIWQKLSSSNPENSGPFVSRVLPVK